MLDTRHCFHTDLVRLVNKTNGMNHSTLCFLGILRFSNKLTPFKLSQSLHILGTESNRCKLHFNFYTDFTFIYLQAAFEDDKLLRPWGDE